MSLLRRYLPLATSAIAITALYFYKLSGVGVLSTDEPRYAAIARAMAQSGDWITPTLWGSPWFEKPPLIYWMSGIFVSAGFGPELAARLPVVLLSLGFLAVMAWLVELEFGAESAIVATSMLATSAGWLAYSSLCLTDLPLAVFFSLAILLALPLLRDRAEVSRLHLRMLAIGVCFGLAALAKGLVPFVLALPLIWFLRNYWRAWWLAVVSCLAVAAPWYGVMCARHGMAFVNEFFLKHHFARFYSDTLQHVQPWYYYIPVLLAALFPWTPLLALFVRRTAPWDQRRLLLAVTAVFGFLFFSVTRNKLPGYLLPLIPSLLVLLGSQFEHRRIPELSRKWLIPSAALIALIPIIAFALPAALAAGRLTMFHVSFKPEGVFYVALPLVVILLGRRSWIFELLLLCIVAGGLLLKIVAYPVMDETVSARGLFREIQRRNVGVCDGGVNRDWVYGLSFYLGREVKPCTPNVPSDHPLRAKGHARPEI